MIFKMNRNVALDLNSVVNFSAMRIQLCFVDLIKHCARLCGEVTGKGRKKGEENETR